VKKIAYRLRRFFSAGITDRARVVAPLKPQIFPRMECVTTQHYRTPTSVFQIAARLFEIKGGLSARVETLHGIGQNVLLL
jgi:hypothetical protein